MMGYVMGTTEPDMVAGLHQLGSAVQHVNVARDVVDDARASRVYLPEEWLEATGIPCDRVADPRFRSRLTEVVRRLLDRAAGLREAGLDRVRAMPFRYWFVVNAALLMYSDIGRTIVRRGERAWDRRVVVNPEEGDSPVAWAGSCDSKIGSGGQG